MIKNKMRDSKGITLTSLAITVAALTILVNVVIYNITSNIRIDKLEKLRADVENLQDKINDYYLENDSIPIKLEYTNTKDLQDAHILSSAFDTGKFFVIDLEKIDNLTLNYGKDYEHVKKFNSLSFEIAKQYKDLYIINETSHNIFYVKGMKIGDEVYYTNYASDEVDKVGVDLKSSAGSSILSNEKVQIKMEKPDSNWSMAYEEKAEYIDENGKTAYIPKGFQVSLKPGENTVNKGLVIKDSLDNRYVWIEVPKTVYKTITSDKDYTNMEKDLQNYVAEYRNQYVSDTWYNGCGIASEKEYNELKNKMLKTIYDEGGFYVGQYISGLNKEKRSGLYQEEVESILNTNGNPVIQENKYLYNFVTCNQAQKLANTLSSEEYINSVMFEIQWELMCKFINESQTQNIKDLDKGMWEMVLANRDGKFVQRRKTKNEDDDVVSGYSYSTIGVNEFAENSGFRMTLFFVD